jgi:hypothetical protein
MKIYQKLVIRIHDDKVLENDTLEYDGPISHAGGGSKAKSSGGEVSPSGQIIQGLSPEISGAIRSRVLGGDSSASTQRAIQQATQASNANFGARGLGGSGIATRAANEIASDTALRGAAQDQASVINLLAAGSGAPVFGPQQQPKGIFGLK